MKFERFNVANLRKGNMQCLKLPAARVRSMNPGGRKKRLHGEQNFPGDYTSIYINNKPAKLRKEKDWLGNIISFTDVIVEPGRVININVM